MDIDEFIAKWHNAKGSERSNAQTYLNELCGTLGVPAPNKETNNPEADDYVFEARARLFNEDGKPSIGKIDLLKRGAFVLEAKQLASRESHGWHAAMTDAKGQAFKYARTFDEPPPFVIVADVGYCFDLYASFDGTGAYRAFPNAQKHRIYLKQLRKHRDVLRGIWLDPSGLDPSRYAKRVTESVANELADLARELEGVGHDNGVVSKFVMRCVFTMFAEDIGLLPDNVFTKYIKTVWRNNPRSFKGGAEQLWHAMNAGKDFYILGTLLRFNGGLFRDPVALSLTGEQLRVLERAAEHDWAEVEPAIFGTLLERALDTEEREKLGAHFTPTEYVRRLIVPTIEEPLRDEWDKVRVRVRELVPANQPTKPANVKKARAAVDEFKKMLCSVRVLDPACGTGNFLYVALHLLKELESEVRATLDDLGVRHQSLVEELTVTPEQFRGIEVKEGAKEIAELVLWIGYLQWHHKMYGGEKRPPEPVLRDYKNIVTGNAVIDASTGSAPEWPEADFIVGNPPFIGNKRMRARLGDQYVEMLRLAYRAHVPSTADYVMYWWQKAADILSRENSRLKRFGFITTNSITQTQNRKLLEELLRDRPIDLAFACPDHPWIDPSREGGTASVRIAMTVARNTRKSGPQATVLASYRGTRRPRSDDRIQPLRLSPCERINPDLTSGVDVTKATPLKANENVCFQGMNLVGKGFRLSPEQVREIGATQDSGILKRYLQGGDLKGHQIERYVIDFYGKNAGEARKVDPVLYNHILRTVKPERDKNRRSIRSKNWWLFGETVGRLRRALVGLDSYIATVETSSYRFFVMVESEVIPDHKLYAIASDDYFHLGVLSSRFHELWATRAGGKNGVGNDSTWTNTKTFYPFPFPKADNKTKNKVRQIAEQLDNLRKEVLGKNPSLSLTDIYHVVTRMRHGSALAEDQENVRVSGLCDTVLELHNALDKHVAAAYGWSSTLSAEGILENLFALNQERALNEAYGDIQWLRPGYQKPSTSVREDEWRQAPTLSPKGIEPIPWPRELPEQVSVVRDILLSASRMMTANDVAAACVGASAQRVASALRTLEALGIAASYKNGSVRWKGLARTTGERISEATGSE